MRVGRFWTVRAVASVAVLALVTGACSAREDPASPSPASAQPSAEATPDDLPAAAPWPTGSPASLGFAPARLRAQARETKRMDSTCLAVVRNGSLAGQWNWDMESTAPREVFSATKSVTSALVGIALRDGSLSLDDRVATYVPAWRGTPSARVTVRNLLSNDSGRFWSQETDYLPLIQAEDRTAYAIGLSQQYPPGNAWAYNNSAIQVLEEVLREATGQPVADFAAERLFEPLGMADTTMTTDPSGHAPTFFGLQSTCLDLARFAQLYLDGGTVQGTRILPRGYVRASIGRPSTTFNAAYGYLWWLNRPGPLRGSVDEVDAQGQPINQVSGQLAPNAPASSYAAQGLGGQTVFVDPESGTIVVRLGGLGGAQPYDFASAARVLTALR